MTAIRVYTDGAARGNPGPAGLGVVVEDDGGTRLRGLCRYIGTATNNKAEYLALIEGIGVAAQFKPERLELYMDSKLVVEQLAGRYRVRHPELQPLHRRARQLLEGFSEWTVRHVPREANRGADALANRAIDDWQGGVRASPRSG